VDPQASSAIAKRILETLGEISRPFDVRTRPELRRSQWRWRRWWGKCPWHVNKFFCLFGVKTCRIALQMLFESIYLFEHLRTLQVHQNALFTAKPFI
jgi:hypothetical protein